MLSRSMNYFSADIYAYQNKPDKKIITYCNDERESIRVAIVFVQRGVDNVYIINGGLRKICAKYPEVLEGPSPAFPPDKKLMKIRKIQLNSNSSSGNINSSVVSDKSVTSSSLYSSASTQEYVQQKLGRVNNIGKDGGNSKPGSRPNSGPQPKAPAVQKKK
ncbi:MAG: hypothetical protein EZS28_051551 [Streblomastix strix]|uniref:Rhodanese domain-containing protein n=1 Tax=Streblomastix strix TaxID=222440 RepID=A0A5J4T4K5_9EUKA|nr:MAG: hypothetical protein EZS28_051551 [Streblomastix strix]